MSVIIAATLLAGVGSAPLTPDLACVVDRVPASARATMLTEAADDGPSPVRQALTAAAAACASERSWSEVHSRKIERTATATMLREEAGRELAKAGIPVARVDAWFDAQSRDVQTRVDMDDAVLGDLVDHLVREGVPPATFADNVLRIGQYVGARVSIARFRAGMEF